MSVLGTWKDRRVETAVELLLAAADDAGCLKNPAWSVAEIGLAPSDLDRLLEVAVASISSWEWALRRNFQSLSGTVRLPNALGTMAPTAKEGLGLLLLALLAGLSRRHGTTDSCFRPCQRNLPQDLRNLLFQGSTLSRWVMPAIEDACHRFRLRLAGPEHSFQRWYLTVRLHEGLSVNNLENRLPAWLHGDDLPLHLKLLLAPGSLYSSSFAKVWRDILWFARSKNFSSNRDRLRLILEGSVWFQGQDLEVLLDAIASFKFPAYTSSTLGGAPLSSIEEDLSGHEATVELRLDVAGARLGLLARPQASALGAGLTGARHEVLIEGKWQDALLRTPDGGLDWENGGWLAVPFRPTCAVQLLDEEDQPVPGDRHLRLFSEEVVPIFDDQGNPAREPLGTSCGYWFLAPRDALWEQAPPEARSISRQELVLLWLPPGWSPEVSLRLDGEILWSPSTPRTPRPFWLEQVWLEANPTAPGEFEIRKPDGCFIRAAWLEGKTLQILGGNLLRLPTTQEPLVEVRMEVPHDGKTWVVRRQVATRAAMLLAAPPEEPGAWRECRPGSELLLRDLETTPVRICAFPHQTRVFFDHAPGCPVPRRAGLLRGMPGRGEQIALGPEHPRRPEDLASLGVTVVDRGMVQQGSVENDLLRMVLRRRIQLNPEHRILVWFKDQPPRLFPVVSQDGGELTLTLPAGEGDLYAAALLHKNSWLGGWWTDHWWRCMEDPGISFLERFLWIRWLRLPFLEGSAREVLRSLVHRSPAEALLAWGVLPWDSPDDPERQHRSREMLKLRVAGGTLEPAAWPDGQPWRQAVRLLLLGTDFQGAQAQRMYNEVHAAILHQPVPRALLPWGRLLLEFSERWPSAACQSATVQHQSNAQGRRHQWRAIYLHLEPGETITKSRVNQALKRLKEQAAAALRLPLGELERLLEEACSSGQQTVATLTALHQEVFRRLVATILLEGET